jgi:hypothetical protein
MLPSLRTILAAMFVTAILVAMVGTALTPIYPRVEQPLARYARTESPMEQPATHGYAPRAEKLNRPPAAEQSGGASEEGSSRRAKTLVTARVDPAENEAPGSASATAPDKPVTNSTTQGPDVAATGSANPSSTATSVSPGSFGGPAASFAAAAKRVEDRCLSCHREWRIRGIRMRGGVRRRIQTSRDRFTAM